VVSNLDGVATNLTGLTSEFTDMQMEMDENMQKISKNFSLLFPSDNGTFSNETTLSTSPGTTMTTLLPITTATDFPHRYLMIVGGYYSDSSSGTYATPDVDVVDTLSDTTSCTIPRDFNSYDVGGGWNSFYFTDGGLLANRPTVCGGTCPSQNCGSSRAGAQDDCHYYNVTANEWYLLSKMSTKRYYHAILMITPDIMWITGGYTGSARTSSTEYMYGNGTIRAGANLPVPLERHCVVRLDNDTAMVIGGVSALPYTTTFYFDIASETFSHGPELLNQRYYHTCAVFQSALHENRPVVAVTGGSASSSYTRVVEILDYTTENPQWTLLGADLPSSAIATGSGSYVYGARMLPTPTNDGLILYMNKAFFHLYCPSVDVCLWVQLSQTTATSRMYSPAMMYVPYEYCF